LQPPSSSSATSAASEAATTTTTSNWPQYQKHRGSLRCSSPTLPDEELTSMLQNYLDDTSNSSRRNNTNSSSSKNSSSKMELHSHHGGQMASANDFLSDYYPQNSLYNGHQAFLPNVSPSASSLDSGYCGPASVSSSIGMCLSILKSFSDKFPTRPVQNVSFCISRRIWCGTTLVPT
jgi:hypothetical protein